MRGIYSVAGFILIFSSCFAQGATIRDFLSSCFPNVDLTNSKIECRLRGSSGNLNFDLVNVGQLQVTGKNASGDVNKVFKVVKVSHLAPRLSDVGAMDESARFVAQYDAFMTHLTATFVLPCRQMAYATVGIGKTDGSELPTEHVASCALVN